MMKIFQSKEYQNVMNYVYGWGAAAVIIGALFKIMHFQGAGVILTIGMLVEAGIFFLSAFEPPLEHYDWSKVFPELLHSKIHAIDSEAKIDNNVPRRQVKGNDTVANIGLEEADIKQLREGINKIIKSADHFAEATVNVPEFTQKLNNATRSFSQLDEKTQEVSKMLESMAKDVSGNNFETLNRVIGDQIDGIKTQTESYTQQISAVNKNISALNAIYELQINETKDSLESFRGIQNDMNEMLENVSLSLDNTKLFKQETQQLASNVASLNSVYGNMLSIVNN